MKALLQELTSVTKNYLLNVKGLDEQAVNNRLTSAPTTNLFQFFKQDEGVKRGVQLLQAINTWYSESSLDELLAKILTYARAQLTTGSLFGSTELRSRILEAVANHQSPDLLLRIKANYAQHCEAIANIAISPGPIPDRYVVFLQDQLESALTPVAQQAIQTRSSTRYERGGQML